MSTAAAGRDISGRGRDRREPRDGAGEQPQELRFLARHPIDREPGDGGEAGGEIGIDERDGRHRVDTELAAGVEAIPPEPEQTGAQRHQRDGVRRAILDLSRPT